MTELARLTSILQQAITTEELPPERPGVVELGDEVVVELANGYTQRFLVVNPIEVPLDDLRISVESPLGRMRGRGLAGARSCCSATRARSATR